jgi:broad specificity phosphatase PhoE
LEIVFVRHGQPEWIADGKPQMDPKLTELGRLQSQRVAERLAKRGATHFWTSPARRARETAEPFAERIGSPAKVVEDLVELKLPDWSDREPNVIAETFLQARARPPKAWWQGMPGGEDFATFQTRVRKALLTQLEGLGVKLVDEEHSLFHVPAEIGRLVIFGHGGTNSVAMTVLLGVPSVPWEWERFMLHHTGILRLKAVPIGPAHIFSVRAFNDCEHLEKAQRTA